MRGVVMDFWTDIMPAIEEAESKLAAVGGDTSRAPDAVRVFLFVNGAQGVIDNSGYAFFFGEDWPGKPAYEEFCAAYETIGCVEQALDLQRVAATFPFADPHLHTKERQDYIDTHDDEEAFLVRGWGMRCAETKSSGRNWRPTTRSTGMTSRSPHRKSRLVFGAHR